MEWVLIATLKKEPIFRRERQGYIYSPAPNTTLINTSTPQRECKPLRILDNRANHETNPLGSLSPLRMGFYTALGTTNGWETDLPPQLHVPATLEVAFTKA